VSDPMTTPSPFLAWHAEAMRLADKAAFALGELETSLMDGDVAASTKLLSDARAALSAHLLAVPMGEPRAWVCPTEDGDYLRSAPTDHAGWLPLFTKPEGMA
jgi:hypothetical protein